MQDSSYRIKIYQQVSKAETALLLCQNEWERMDANVQYARNALKRVKSMKDQSQTDTGNIGTSTRLATLESILKVNEKWLERRKEESEAAKHALAMDKGAHQPIYRGLYYISLWSPSVLTALSFAAGFACLRRLRNDKEKPGIMQAGASIILSSFLFFIFTISLFARFTQS